MLVSFFFQIKALTFPYLFNMITIVFNNSNVTLYRIPIHNNQTKVFAVPHRSDIQAVQMLIDWFNQSTTMTTITHHTPVSSTVPVFLPVTNKCYVQNIYLIITGVLTVLLLLFFVLFLFFNGRQRKHRYHLAKQYNQSSVCVIDMPDNETDNHGTNSKDTNESKNDANTADDSMDETKEEGVSQ